MRPGEVIKILNLADLSERLSDALDRIEALEGMARGSHVIEAPAYVPLLTEEELVDAWHTELGPRAIEVLTLRKAADRVAETITFGHQQVAFELRERADAEEKLCK